MLECIHAAALIFVWFIYLLVFVLVLKQERNRKNMFSNKKRKRASPSKWAGPLLSPTRSSALPTPPFPPCVPHGPAGRGPAAPSSCANPTAPAPHPLPPAAADVWAPLLGPTAVFNLRPNRTGTPPLAPISALDSHLRATRCWCKSRSANTKG